ncbi:hypothetical protein [Cellvibrio sp. UBA7671]|jgi:hypothetical protein|uniref:hypothetical protein n=1 Tax=Cellvibrio sp. UBA7671 TaxID=1946312 RepID=UPI002F350B67
MKIPIIIFSLMLFAISMWLPAFECTRDSLKGYEVLISGWLGIIGLDPRWYANVLYAYVIFRSLINKNYTPSTISSALLVSAAIASFVFISPLACPAMDTMSPSKGLAVGGKVWCSALISASVLAFLKEPKSVYP